MHAISILGTSSNAGKSWVTAAFCALLKRKGYNVAPFKAQNMSNNSCPTPDGGEIGRAQAVQAEACGLLPSRDMNPILLKPGGENHSQLVVLGDVVGSVDAQSYYRDFNHRWNVVQSCLDSWKSKCDVLVLEGAGSPVELNLMDRDLVNLKPIQYLNGKWLLVSDIDRGGVFSQIVGTWHLLPPDARESCLGAIMNKFRGDPSLLANPTQWLQPHCQIPCLGLLPYQHHLQPENEDGLDASDQARGSGPTIAWIRFPSASNLNDCQPWWHDSGVRTEWVNTPEAILNANAIILPGSKNTLSDLAWLRSTGLDQAILAAAHRGTPIMGICGGYQMLGQSLHDPHAVDGTGGSTLGLGLLPIHTTFHPKKTVHHTPVTFLNDSWDGYEIHMGQTTPDPNAPTSLTPFPSAPLGYRQNHIMGSYLHGIFESTALRTWWANLANIPTHQPHPTPYPQQKSDLYHSMADLLEAHLDLSPIWKYLP